MSKIELIQGDCKEQLKNISDNSVDAIVTDPPYGLEFMGKNWDKGVPGVEFWIEMLRVLKPGGYLLSFSGTRTYHRMATAIEDGGFEIRDMIEWVYGSGFPKSLNIGKKIDQLQGNERKVEKHHIQSKTNPDIHAGASAHITMPNNWKVTKGTSEWEGWGTALKPAHEPICMARKPLSEKTVAENVLKYGTGGINIDESRVEGEIKQQVGGWHHEHTINDDGWNGGEQGQKQPQGRFPANLIHDNSEEVRECFPDTKSGERKGASSANNDRIFNLHGGASEASSGNASRFFKSIIYQAKASKAERNKGCEGLEKKQYSHDGRDKEIENPYQRNKSVVTNNHPTVKPIALMEYLINMVTAEGGTVLDPFMGSGTTGIACKKHNRNFIGIELDLEYFKIAEKRIEEGDYDDHTESLS